MRTNNNCTIHIDTHTNRHAEKNHNRDIRKGRREFIDVVELNGTFTLEVLRLSSSSR